jgi:hypothetical protein
MSFSTCFSIDKSATSRFRRIFLLQIFHPTRLINVQAAILLAPTKVTLVRYPSFPTGNSDRLSLCCSNFDLTQQRHDLFRAKPFLRHDKTPFPSQFLTIRLVQKEPIRSMSSRPITRWRESSASGKWGAGGYSENQISSDTGEGATLIGCPAKGGCKASSYGAGPLVGYNFGGLYALAEYNFPIAAKSDFGAACSTFVLLSLSNSGRYDNWARGTSIPQRRQYVERALFLWAIGSWVLPP